MPKSHNAKGRSLTKGNFALVPEAVMHSPAYRALSNAARAVLFEIALLYRGKNNGFLGLSARQAAERLGCAKDTTARGFRELEAHGLIERAMRGSFTTKTAPLASEWRLAWQRCDRTNRVASHAYLNWKPATGLPLEKKILGPISGTVRSDFRDIGTANPVSRSDHRDSKAGFASFAVRSQRHS